MTNISKIEKGMILNIDYQLWAVVGINFVSPGKGSAFYKMKIKSLRTGNVIERTYKSGEQFEEVELEKKEVKYLYTHRDKYFFCEESNPSARFELDKEILGSAVGFMKPNQTVEAVSHDGKIISISLPIKVILKVTEAPPGAKGDRAQSGTKMVTLETGAQINAPLFVEEGDVIEINTETGEYVKRVE
ncbi:MAG: elongation factor P [Candidatus Paceibacterota bacterium]|jgi:elongation factor P